MSTVRAFIRTVSKSRDFTTFIRFRLTDGRKIQLFHKSEFRVNPHVWDNKKECIKTKILYNAVERAQMDLAVSTRKGLLIDVYEHAENKESLTSAEFEKLIDMRLHPDKYKKEGEELKNFYFWFEKFLFVKNYPHSDEKNYETMIRMLRRFEMFQKVRVGTDYVLDFKTINVDTIRDIERYVRDEYKYVGNKSYKFIFDTIPDKRMPRVRGANTIAKLMKRFRTFIKWCLKEGLLESDPFVGYEQKSPVYGTPYYITIEECSQIADTNLQDAWERLDKEQQKAISKSSLLQLTVQRDIFIFHCMIGCRVGDLVTLTPENVINDHISYIAKKTSKERVDAIEVPLNSTAKSILEKYWDGKRMTGPLLPFITPQKYNDSIKEIFLLCGITRSVTIWNSTTGKEEQHPLNEIASSHLARRTFIGNLYKKVQDPNMIGKLSGHVEGSRAFARYRTIDDDMKQNLVKMLD